MPLPASSIPTQWEHSTEERSEFVASRNIFISWIYACAGLLIKRRWFVEAPLLLVEAPKFITIFIILLYIILYKYCDVVIILFYYYYIYYIIFFYFQHPRLPRHWEERIDSREGLLAVFVIYHRYLQRRGLPWQWETGNGLTGVFRSCGRSQHLLRAPPSTELDGLRAQRCGGGGQGASDVRQTVLFFPPNILSLMDEILISEHFHMF